MTDGLADLHRHLDGSLRPATLADLAARSGQSVPPDLCFSSGMGLEAALARFAFVLRFLQAPEPVRRVADEICEDAIAEGISTLEIRFAPQLHRGASVEAIVDAALAGIAGRAGLILCGLYGEPPAVLAHLVRVAATRPGVVGLDLAGGPAPGHDWRLEDYAVPFRDAAECGLGRTVHAGEGRPAAEIRQAIEVLGAQRIGHGTTLLDDPAVVELALIREVTIEACPTSNVHTGVIDTVADHPLAAWLDRGMKVTVCTDNTLLSAVALPDELHRVRAIPGIDDRAIAATMAHGHAGAFVRP